MVYLICKGAIRLSGFKLPFNARYLLLDLVWVAAVFLTSLYLPSLEQHLRIAVLTILFLTVCITDFKYYIIPNALLIAFALPALGIALLGNSITAQDAGLGGISGFLLFYAVSFLGEKAFKKEALGGGDIKLAAVLGLYIGWQGILPMLFIGSFSALIAYGIVYIGKRNIQSHIPFGPFLIIGSILSPYYLEWVIKIINYNMK